MLVLRLGPPHTQPWERGQPVTRSAKRALGDANRLCRETVRKYLFGKEPVVVHDSDCTVSNAYFVLHVLLKANPDLTLAVRNDTFYPTLGLGEIEKKENERAEAHSARDFKYILWPPAVNQPQLSPSLVPRARFSMRT